jgi:hypothetical protein
MASCRVSPVLSYLDAGTGSMIIAALAGGVAGVAVLFKMYWNRFLGVFSKKHRRKAEVAQGDLLGVEIDPETGLPVDEQVAGEATEAEPQPEQR